MNKFRSVFLIAIGLALGVMLSYGLTTTNSHNATSSEDSSSNEPLYWVAPMDPNFKRDQPGKSPMGMDLVPVYEKDQASDSPGTVLIDPSVINNVGVKTSTLEMITPTNAIHTYGRVEYAKDKMVHIHPRIEGWVERLYVRSQGDFVEKDAPLYSLYSPELVNAQEEFLLAVQQGNNNLITAATARLAALNVSKSVITRLRETNQTQREVTFYASQTGFVSELNIQEGFYVKPSMTLLGIAALDSVWVIADVFAKDAAKVTRGQKAIITSEFLAGQDFESEIDYVYPTLNPLTKTLQVRIPVANPAFRLKPDMFMQVAIETLGNSKQAQIEILAVPQQAVIKTGRQNRVVLALGEGKFKSVEVKLGQYFGDQIEVLEGLVENDEVVVSAQFLLDSESSITSDFARMASSSEANESLSAWTHATVNAIMPEERMINLSHGPLEPFGMMGMTMNFMLAQDIDVSVLASGMSIHVEIVKTESGMYQVNTVHIMDDETGQGGHHQ